MHKTTETESKNKDRLKFGPFFSIFYTMTTISPRARPFLRCFCWIVVLLSVPHIAASQSDSVAIKLRTHGEAEGDTARIDGGRLAIVAGTVAIGITAIHLYQQKAWWSGARGPFHFEEDLVYARNIDKVGHFVSANALTYIFSKGLRWANLEEQPSLMWGAVGSTAFQTYIELEDGFSRYWGFDRVDYAADLAGAWYPLLQYHVPFLKNFNFRTSYLPKTEGAPGGIPGQTHTAFDDYEGQTFWLALTMKNILPAEAARWWPDFLCLSLGVAVRDNLSPDRYLVWFIAPDLDFTRILPQDTPFLRTLAESLNFIHLPMPAIRIAPNVVWYGIYF
jgi:hypothetical protein